VSTESEDRAKSEPYLRCTNCALELAEDETEGLERCPRCGSQGVPMLVADDVTVEVNWHELRILCMWAENWAAQTKDATAARNEREGSTYPDPQRTVNIVAGRIHAQFPDKPPLTMTGELGDLKKWADEHARGMEISGFTPNVEASPELDEDPPA
jgi:DNA-directed RNA polymerase subunit RPC12/RpoP